MMMMKKACCRQSFILPFFVVVVVAYFDCDVDYGKHSTIINEIGVCLSVCSIRTQWLNVSNYFPPPICHSHSIEYNDDDNNDDRNRGFKIILVSPCCDDLMN